MKIVAVLRGSAGDQLSDELVKMLGIHPGVYPIVTMIRVRVRLKYDDTDPGLTPKVLALSGPLKGRNLALFGVEIEIEC